MEKPAGSEVLFNAPIGFAICSVVAGRQHENSSYRLIEVNPALEKMCGLDKDTMVGKEWHELFPETPITGPGWHQVSGTATAQEGTAGYELYFPLTGKHCLVKAMRTDDTHHALFFTDITSIRRMPESAFVKDAQLNALWNNDLFGVMIADNTGRYLDVNEEACRMTGYSAQELKNMTLFQLIDPLWAAESRTHLEKVGNKGKAYGEIAYFTKTGEKRWWNVVAVKLTDTCYLGLHEDTTNRRRAEELLREEEVHHADLISHISDVLWEYQVDQAGNSVSSYISPSADSILGLPPGSIGHNFELFLRFTHPEDTQSVWETIQSSLFSDQRKVHRVEYRVVAADGTIKHLRSSGIVRIQPNGNRLATGTTSDITELKEKEADLLKTRANLSAIVENTPDSIWAINDRYEIIFINESFRQAYRATFQVELFPGANKLKSLPESMVPVWKDRYDRVLGGEPVEFVDTVEMPGMTVFIEVTGNPIVQQGKVIGASFFGRDISGKKKMELELSHNVEFNKKLLATIPDVVIQTTVEGIITFINESAFVNFPFLTRGQLLGRSFLSFVAPRDMARVGENYQRMFHGALGAEEYTFILDNGIEIPCEVNGEVMRDEWGNPLSLVFVVRDISGRRQAEKNLLQEHLRFQHLFENSPSATWLEDITGMIAWFEQLRAEGVSDLKRFLEENPDLLAGAIDRIRVIDVNRAVLEQNAAESKEQLMASIQYLFEQRTLREFAYELDCIWQGKEQVEYESHCKRLNGQPMHLIVRLTIPKHEGELDYSRVVVIGVDITERKKAEEEKESAMSILKSALAQSPSGILIADAPDVRIRYANEAALMIRGKSPESLTGIDVSSHSESWQTFRLDGTSMPSEELPLSRAILKGETVRDVEVIIRHEKGDDRYVSANAAPIRNAAGEVTAGIVVFHDITERKQAEDTIHSNERAFAEINECLVSLGPDYDENINKLTSLCGKLLGATCALYNRLDGGMLCSLGQWGVPDDYNPIDKPEGHICYDVIRRSTREVYLVRNLPESGYFESDPNVRKYNLVTYAGHAVFSGNEAVGSLCVVYQQDIALSPRDTGILSIVASALASEEVRFRSQKAIGESTRKYRELSTLLRLMADNMQDMLWAKNLNKEYIFVNKALCNNLLIAADSEEPLGKTDMFFAMRQRNAHPDNPMWHTFGEICRDSDSITVNELKPMQFDEFGNVRGRFLFLDVHKAPLFDDTGQLIGVVGSARDVTATREAIEEIRWRNEDLQLMNAITIAANRSLDFSAIINLVASHLKANFDTHLLGIFLPDGTSGKLELFANALDPDLTKKIEKIIRRPMPRIRVNPETGHVFDGIDKTGKGILTVGKEAIERRMAAYLEGTPWKLPARKVIEKLLPVICNILEYRSSVAVAMKFGEKTNGFLELGSRNTLTLRDLDRIQSIADHLASVLARFDSEKKRKESEERMTNAFMYATIGMAFISPEGKLLRVNPSVPDMLGYSEKDLLKKSLSEITHPDDVAGDLACFGQMLDGTIRTSKTEKRYIHKSGRTVWVIQSVSLVRDQDGKPIHFIMQMQDITDRKLAEEEINTFTADLENRVEERTAQLREANREMEAFSYSVSHDLRAPLRAIHGYASILMEDYSALIDDEGKRVCASLRENTAKMGNLIDDLLSFSRCSRAEIRKSRINTKALFLSAYEEVADEQTRQSIDLILGDMINVHGDPILIRQVLINLVSNAVKFSSKKARPVITAGFERIDNRMVFCIHDNGAGFDMKYADRIFGVFERLHTSREFDGTGVGLAIVKRIIERHGGEVWAKGEVDKGASFYFTLPSGS